SDVIFLCDEVITLRNGKVEAQGPPRSALLSGIDRRGREREICNTFRVQCCEREAESRAMRCDIGGLWILGYSTGDAGDRSPLTCTVRASDVILASGKPEGLSARNIVSGRIREISDLGERGVVAVEAGPQWMAEISRASLAEMNLRPGQVIYMVLKA